MMLPVSGLPPAKAAETETLEAWVERRFLKAKITPMGVARFLSDDLDLNLTPILANAPVHDLAWIVIHHALDKRLHAAIDDLTSQEKIFLAQAKHEFAQVARTLEVNFDLHELWSKK